MNKILITLLSVMLAAFLVVGCGRKDRISKTPNITNPSDSITTTESGKPSEINNETSNKNISNNDKPKTESTNDQMQQLSNSMDKLDKTLADLDDSNDIKEIESVINNNLQ